MNLHSTTLHQVYSLKKKGIEWHKTSIPQAGGHAATKKTLVNAGFKTGKAVIETAQMFRKINPDIVVGVIGGGAVEDV